MNTLPQILKSDISRFASRRFWVVLGLWMLVLLLPYGLASQAVPDGYAWSGLISSPTASNVHLSWMRQAAQGEFFVRDLFTTEWIASGEKPRFWNGFFWLLGRFCALTGCPLIWAYHGARVVFAGLLFWRFDVLCRLVAGARVAFWAGLLAAFSLGSGVLAPFFPRTVFIDRLDGPFFPFVPEAFTFSAALLFPLNVAAMCGLILIWENVMRVYREPKQWRASTFKAGLCALWVGNLHTYDIVPLMIGLALVCLWVWRDAVGIEPKRAVIAVALGALGGALPPMLYQGFVWFSSTEFRLKALSLTEPPPLLDLLLCFAVLLLPALYAAGKSRRMETKILLCWLLPNLFCAYLPLSFGRKMLEGAHLPLSILAALGLILALSRFSVRVQRGALTLYTLTACASLPLLIQQLDEWTRVNNTNRMRVMVPPVHLSDGDWGALRYLQTQKPRGVVLCLPLISGYVPQTTGHTVFCGVWAETLDFDAKIKQTLDFYNGALPPAQLRAWLRKNHITWIIQGDYERRWCDVGKFPARALNLSVAWRGQGCTLYRVPA